MNDQKETSQRAWVPALFPPSEPSSTGPDRSSPQRGTFAGEIVNVGQILIWHKQAEETFSAENFLFQTKTTKACFLIASCHLGDGAPELYLYMMKTQTLQPEGTKPHNSTLLNHFQDFIFENVNKMCR